MKAKRREREERENEEKSSIVEPKIADRYSRHILIPGFGLEKQLLISKASVLVIGCGGLGSALCMNLAGSGIGKIGLIDNDIVELSNLHRQIIHNESNLKIYKTISASEYISKLNSSVSTEIITSNFTSLNASIVTSYDIICDCTDNISSRYFINDVCVLSGKPIVAAAAVCTYGQLSVFNYNDGPCRRCLFPVTDEGIKSLKSTEIGIIGPLPAVMGSLMAIEVIKMIISFGDVLSNKILTYDCENNHFNLGSIRGKDKNCIVCGINPQIK